MKRKMFLCLMLCLALSYSYAVKVSPVRLDQSITRGTSKEFSLSLMGSKGLHNQDLVIYASDLSMNRVGALFFDITKSKNSAVKWIKIERSKLSLLENQAKDVKVKISIPASATPGEYYAVIMVEPEKFTKVKDKEHPVMMEMKTRVAVVIVLDVPGRTYQKKGKITEMNVIQGEKSVKITSSFQNTGDIHLDVAAEVIIRSVDGKTTYGKFDLNALSSSKKEAFIFPNSIRDFEGVLKRELPTGDYVAAVSYNYGYNFKKANQTQKFSIKRKTSLNESSNEFLGFVSKDLKLTVPVKATRTQVIKVTNTDYRPLNVLVSAEDWVKVNPKSFTLKPGEVRNIQAVISVSEYKDKEPIKKTSILFKTDRGKSSTILLSVFKPGTPIPAESVEKVEEVKNQTTENAVAEGDPGKKFEEPTQVAQDSQLVASEEPVVKDSVVIKVKDSNVAFTLSRESLYLVIAGFIILILLFIVFRKKNGKEATK